MLAWAAGSTTYPQAEKAYSVLDLELQVRVADSYPNGQYMGQNSPYFDVVGGVTTRLQFTSEFRGSDSGGLPPPEGRLMRACGFNEDESGTIPAIQYTYTLSNDVGSLTHESEGGDIAPVDLNRVIDFSRQKASGCVGNVVFTWGAASIPTMSFSFIGQKGPSGTIAMPTYYPGRAPFPVKDYGLTMQIDGGGTITSLISSLISYDVGNNLVHRPCMDGDQGYSRPTITDRDPVIIMVVEAPNPAIVDFESLYLNQNDLDFVFWPNRGGLAGEPAKVGFTARIAQYPVVQSQNGKAVYTLHMRQSVASGATAFYVQWLVL